MASFIERATLLVNDQSSKPLRNINNELKSLFATASKLRSMKLNLAVKETGAKAASANLKKLVADANKLKATKTELRVGAGNLAAAERRVTALQHQLRNLNGAVNVTGIPNIPRGGGGNGVGGGGRSNNVFFGTRNDGNMLAAGRLMARGFMAGIGARFGIAAVEGVGRTAGRGVLGIDDARALAGMSGINVADSEAAATKAAAGTKGISIADIMSAIVEQQGQLEGRLKAGTITQKEYADQLNATAAQVARSSQIYGQLAGSFEKGAEEARQQQKALDLLGKNTPAERAATGEAMLKGQIAAGGDVTAADTKRKLQQLGPVLAKSLTDRGLQILIAGIDEGGAQAAAEMRSGMRDLTRGDLNKKDKAAQLAAGLRTERGKSTLTQEQIGDPFTVAQDVLIPKLKALGVNLDSVTDVSAALDNQLGFTTKGTQLYANIISNLAQKQLEISRTQSANPQAAIDKASLRANLAEINASLQDAIGKAVTSTGALAAMKATSDAAGGAITDLTSGKVPTAGGAAALGGAAVLAAVTALTTADRPDVAALGGAALALDGSAAALTAAAAAQTAAAGVGAAGGKGVWFGKLLGLGTLATGAFAVLSKAVSEDAARQKAGDKNTLIGGVRDIFKGAQVNIAIRDAKIATEKSLASQRIGIEDRLTRDRTKPAEITSIRADSIVVKNLSKFERSDRELAAARGLSATAALDDRATRVRNPNEFEKMLSGMGSPASAIQAAFGEGGSQAGSTMLGDIISGGAQAASSIVGAGPQVGGAVAAAMLGAAGSIGATIAAAMSAVRVGVAMPSLATPNLGSSHPGKD
ncbi:hypothetical protein [Mesorhizobium sp.]|uniref:hypothetical protein n=1 Tax=Mesorhizobium sp. TaxID=1871066 RepID=UPI000FE87EDA|nr:hypothetical protein [Mesorhizobium sp.]RWO89553.1 MAG: hypothetical protein EOQ96_05175 [Mesorhizobium sp.]